MKKLLMVFVLGLGISGTAFAQLATENGDLLVAPSGDQVSAFIGSLGKAGGPMGIALAVAQGLMYLFLLSPKLQAASGKVKLAVAAGLHLVVGALSLKVSGLSWPEVIAHAGVLPMIGTFLHQVLKQGLEPGAAGSGSSASGSGSSSEPKV